jgi:uncharacterized protein YabE (DUF348 family)/3D (Asp-Asp-Asp) domain-containing protein
MFTLKLRFERMKDVLKSFKGCKRPAFTVVSALSLSLAVVIFMTGVLYFGNDVLITETGVEGESVTRKFFTMKEDGEEILREFGYTLGEFDRVIHGETVDGHNLIEIVRGFGVEIIVDAGRFMGSAVQGETVHMILSSNDVEIGRYDVTIFNENSIEVFRGFGVEVTADGQTVTIGTIGAAVGDILQRAGIELGEDDIVNMPLNAHVLEGAEIVVNRVRFAERTDVEPIPYEISLQRSNLVALGETEVKQGEYGEMTFVYREKLVDGVAVSSEIVSKEQTKDPVTEIVMRGNALKTPYSKRDFPEIKLENGIPVDYVAKHSGKSTAYTAPPTSGTASGRRLEIGTVAVNPNIIPYGSLLYIVTQCGSRVYGAAVAADTGLFAAMSGPGIPIVDVFMGLTSENFHEALRWGAQMVDVYVINTGVY